MLRQFEGHGIRLEYPEDWIPHEQSAPNEFTLTVNSPTTAFWSVTVLLDKPTPRSVMDSALAALREEYSEIDVYDSPDILQDQTTLAQDVDFVCHDLIGSAFLRAIAGPHFTLFVLYQAADLELDELQSVLERISQSLRWDSSEDRNDAAFDEFSELWGTDNELPQNGLARDE